MEATEDRAPPGPDTHFEWYEYRINGYHAREHEGGVDVLIDGFWEPFESEDAAEDHTAALE